MAVAKKWKLETALGISTCLARVIGLPLSLDSAATNCSILFSIPSENFTKILLRCSEGIADQIGKANSAAETATAKSFSSESGIREYTKPVEGSILSKYN